jgi:hypothetical protein
MATIQMTGSTFTVCPEGRHIFRIYKVDFNQDFGKVTVYMVNAQGITHRENFGLMRADGSMNDGACNAFSFFARTALNDFSREAIDHTELVGRYIGAEVSHTVQPNKNDPTKTVTFANLVGEKWVAEGFDTTPVKRALTLGTEIEAPKANVEPEPVAVEAPTPTTGLDLNALLG